MVWATVARVAVQWVGWNALVLGVHYAASMLYLHVCTSPPWVDVWRAVTLAWSPSVGCLLLNQAQFFTQYIYLYNGAILVVAGLHELVRLALASYPLGAGRPWPLAEMDECPRPKSRPRPPTPWSFSRKRTCRSAS